MSYIVYVKAPNSARNAHQYVQLRGQRIGELWREQVHIADRNGSFVRKWRWFAEPIASSMAGMKIDSGLLNKASDYYGTKDKAVDFLEEVARKDRTANQLLKVE